MLGGGLTPQLLEAIDLHSPTYSEFGGSTPPTQLQQQMFPVKGGGVDPPTTAAAPGPARGSFLYMLRCTPTADEVDSDEVGLG